MNIFFYLISVSAAFLGGLLLNRRFSIIINNIQFYFLKKDIKKMFTTINYSVENNLLHFSKKIIIDLKTNNLFFKDFYKALDQPNQDSGVCGDLSFIIYNKIKETYHEQFKIRVVEGHEPDFFYRNVQGAFCHVFLTVQKKDGNTFVIDPSFKKIVSLENHSYEIVKETKPLNLTMYPDLKLEIPKKGSKNFFPVKFIGEYLILLGFSFQSREGFSFELFSKRKNFRHMNLLFKIAKENGITVTDDKLGSVKTRNIENPVANDDISEIKNKLIRLFGKIEIIE